MRTSLAGRRVIVTEAGRGIGRRFTEVGCRVLPESLAALDAMVAA
ncbi:hypothetical protein [Acidisoma sp. 7E03]